MKTTTLPAHETAARLRRAATDKPTSGSNERRIMVAGKPSKPVAPQRRPKLGRTATGQFASKVKAK